MGKEKKAECVVECSSSNLSPTTRGQIALTVSFIKKEGFNLLPPRCVFAQFAVKDLQVPGMYPLWHE